MATGDIPEAELLQSCLDGSKKAWDSFVKRFSNLIYHSIYQTFTTKSFVCESHIVDDIYQDVFLSLVKNDFRKLRLFEGKNNCSLASWLRMIACRTAIDFMRKQRPTISIDNNSSPGKKLTNSLANGSDPPDEALQRSQEYQLLKELIISLPPKDQLLFDLHYHRELPDKEIAQIVNVSIEALYMRKSRLRDKLKSIAEEKKIM